MDFVQRFLKARRTVDIDFDPHALVRMQQRPEATPDRVEAVARRGLINLAKCQELPDKPYSKICSYLYFHQANVTVEVILLHHEAFEIAEVKSVWVHKGRRARKGARRGRRSTASSVERR